MARTIITQSNKQALVALLLLSLLGCNVFVQSSRIHGMQVTSTAGSCNTPDSCSDSQTDLEGILEPCLSAAQGNSIPAPGDGCCQGINSLDASCLCKALKLALSFTILHINATAALAMPEECGYPVPQNCVCDGHAVPTASLA